MKTKIPPNSEILNWDPENMETYWQQCQQFDTRPLTCFEKNNVGNARDLKQRLSTRLKCLLLNKN